MTLVETEPPLASKMTTCTVVLVVVAGFAEGELYSVAGSGRFVSICVNKDTDFA